MKRLAVVLLVLLAACGNGGSKDDTDATVPDAAAVSTTTTVGTTSTTADVFGSSPVSTPDTQPQVTLKKLAVGSHPEVGFDRVTFTFRDNDTQRVGYSVAHASPPFTQDGSGNTVAVSGSGHIAVRIIGAAHDEQGKVSYSEGERVKGAGVVTEVVRTGDFEGVLNFVIGTNGDHRFRVFTLSGPSRLVIDVER